ncbi:MAG: hypothetical protein M1839_007594 [Geoglossum umbratile]|nr:MAG: hypothetical protein M1839_007594 [Geoglossum umbratile]
MAPSGRKLLGKLERSWTDLELSQFLYYFWVPRDVVQACSDRAALIELVKQTAEDEHITVGHRISASKQLKQDPSSICPPERITSMRYSRQKKTPEASGRGSGVRGATTFHQPHQPIEDLDEDELQLLGSHALYGSRDPRLRVDDEVYPIDRPQPDPNLEPISSFNAYQKSLFDREGNAAKRLAPLLMKWTSGLSGKCYFSGTGTEYTNHGRGPAWGGWTVHGAIPATPYLNPEEGVIGVHAQANSCGVDSLIVAGMFLDVGQTVADRGSASRSEWISRLTPIQKQYLDVVRTDWNDYTAVGSVKRKKAFYDEVLKGLGYSYFRSTPAAGIWMEQLAGGFHQFTFHTAVQKTCAICGATSLRGRRGGQLRLSVDVEFGALQKNPNFTLSNYLRYHFDDRAYRDKKNMQKNFHHDKPPSKARNVVVGGMPPRLVITPETRDQATVPLPEHTKGDISFRYEDEVGKEHSVIYRWIGGIYMDSGHYRVYWDDSESGEGRIKVYDGQHPRRGDHVALLGMILGGIEPPGGGERVPAPWCEGPGLLFYERVDNPLDGGQINALEGVLDKLKSARADSTGEQQSLNLLPISEQIERLTEDGEKDNTAKIALLKKRKRVLKELRDTQKQEVMQKKQQARELTLAEARERRRPAIILRLTMKPRQGTGMDGAPSSTLLQGLLGNPQENPDTATSPTIREKGSGQSVMETVMETLKVTPERKRKREEGDVDGDNETTPSKKAKTGSDAEPDSASTRAQQIRDDRLRKEQWFAERQKASEDYAKWLTEQEEEAEEKRAAGPAALKTEPIKRERETVKWWLSIPTSGPPSEEYPQPQIPKTPSPRTVPVAAPSQAERTPSAFSALVDAVNNRRWRRPTPFTRAGPGSDEGSEDGGAGGGV